MTQLPEVTYRFISEAELPEIVALLKTYELPVEDISLKKMAFITAHVKEQLAGCIGIEAYENHGLLRSLAVKKDFQNLGIGGKLIDYLIGYCKQNGIHNLHLLTLTTSEYFLTKGFKNQTRDQAPVDIAKSQEFTHLCPASESIYMVKSNLSQTVSIYHRDLLLWKTDPDTDSSYWEVSGEKQSFTFFKVPSNQIFPKHQHENEQITHVIQGRLYFEIDGAYYIIGPGDSIVIPSNTWHTVWTENESVVAVDSWSPARTNLSS